MLPVRTARKSSILARAAHSHICYTSTRKEGKGGKAMRFWPRKKVSTIDPTTAVQDDPLILREARAIAPKANSGKGPGKYFGEVVIPQSQINIAGDMVREMSGLADKMAAAQRKAELDNQVAEALLEGAQAIARSKERTEVLFNEEVVDKLRKS